ncbi:TlpA family protein disulfide reductase [candidate division KSB1 bacterium]|nr:TlpA family protein disulfide reductase [candidate division KSB1 bacterium]
MRYFFVILLFLWGPVFAGTPDFTLPGLDAETVKLSENFGKGPIIINFWATWCLPCKAEMKALKKVYKKYQSRDLHIFSISIDDPKTVNRVKSFVKANRYPFTVLLDTNSEVFRRFGGTHPPLTIVLDREGAIRYSHTGYRKGDENLLMEQLEKF